MSSEWTPTTLARSSEQRCRPCFGSTVRLGFRHATRTSCWLRDPTRRSSVAETVSINSGDRRGATCWRNLDRTRARRAAVQTPLQPNDAAVALNHVVRCDESFEQAAAALIDLALEAQRIKSGRRRLRDLDIEGHRNAQGGFDHDMLELQRDFVLGFLMPFLSEAYLPLGSFTDPSPQQADIPGELTIEHAAR